MQVMGAEDASVYIYNLAGSSPSASNRSRRRLFGSDLLSDAISGAAAVAAGERDRDVLCAVS